MYTATAAPSLSTQVLHIAAVAPCGADTVLCTLVPPEGQALAPWTAGAHLDVHLPGGLVRPYSLCSDPADTQHYRIAVKREPQGRGGSVAFHAHVRAGGTLTVGQPRNLFALSDDASHYLLVGGGIGVTPLLAMAHTLHARQAAFTLAVFARSPEHLPLPSDWQQWPWADQVQIYCGLERSAAQAQLGQLQQALPATARVYTCGPHGFMEAVRTASALPAGRIHSEHFSAPTTAAPAAAAGAFEVILARQGGRRIAVAADQSMADALHGAGVAVDMVCEQGVCGSCITRFTDGTPIHHDACLAADEQATHLAVCCARSATPTLTLDL